MSRYHSRAAIAVLFGAIALGVFASDDAIAFQAGGKPASERQKAEEACRVGRTIEYVSAAFLRKSNLTFVQAMLDLDIRSAHEYADINSDHLGRTRQIDLFTVGFHTLVGAAVCTYFCRQKGVTPRERALCIAALLAVTGVGLWEALSTHRANVAGAREVERLAIVAADATAAEARLTARWQYERRIAAADLVFDRCLAQPEANP